MEDTLLIYCQHDQHPTGSFRYMAAEIKTQQAFMKKMEESYGLSMDMKAGVF